MPNSLAAPAPMRPAAWLSRRRALALLGVFALALAPRWLLALSFPPEAPLASVDALGYHALALNLLAGRGFTLNTEPPFVPDAVRTPLYPALVALVYAVTGPQPRHVALAQGAWDSVTAVVLASLAHRLAGGRGRAGWVAGGLYALNPTAWRFCNELLTECLLAGVLTWLLWVFAGVAPPARSRPWLLGALAGAALLIKPNLVLLPLLVAAAEWVRLQHERIRHGGHARARMAAVLLPVLVAAVVAFPWLVRNRVVFGRWLFSHAFENNLARVSAVAALARAQGERVAPWTPRWEALYSGLLLEAERRYGPAFAAVPGTALEADRTQRQLAAVAGEVVRRHPLDFALAHVGGFVRSWVPQEHRFWYGVLAGGSWESLGSAEGVLGQALAAWRAQGPAAALGLVWQARWASLPPLARAVWLGWVLAYTLSAGLLARGVWATRGRPAFLLLCLGLIFYATFLPGPIAHVRFRVPVAPALIALMALGAAARLPAARAGRAPAREEAPA